MKLVYRAHAIRRMFQRRISPSEVRQVVAHGEVIVSYPADTPYPSRLILGWAGQRPLHVLVAERADHGELIVVTAYEPDPDLWDPSFRQRRQS